MSKRILSFLGRQQTLAAIVAALVAFFASAARAGAQEIREGGAETIDVELRTVPFYAVDEAERGVHDLSADEVRILVNGTPIDVDSLDHWAKDAAAPAPLAEKAPGEEAAAEPAVELPRHVFVMVDQTFVSRQGFTNAQQMARELLDELPAGDRLHLLTYHSRQGLRLELGPVPATEEGRSAMRSRIAKLRPDTTASGTSAGLPGVVGGGVSSKGPASQLGWVYNKADEVYRSSYLDAGRNLASSYEALAAYLGRLRGSKLLVIFSRSFNSELYFEGSYGLKPGSTPGYHGAEWYAPPLMNEFEGPLKSLAASGVVPIFVNVERGSRPGQSALHHMSVTAGGLFIEEGNRRHVREKIVTSTTAYYEAGFYLREGHSIDRMTRLEVTIDRPGVRVLAPGWLRNRLRYDALTETEQRFLILELVGGGQADPALVTSHDLVGEFRSEASEKGTRLVFEAEWPQAIAGKAVDLYDVKLRLAEGGREIVRFDRYEAGASAKPIRLTAALPKAGKGQIVWGIVAVEPASGELYARRLKLDAQKD